MVAAVVLEMVRPRLGLLAALLGAFIAWETHTELSDPYVGPAILRELGEGYVQSGYLSAVVGFLGPVLVVVFAQVRSRRHSR